MKFFTKTRLRTLAFVLILGVLAGLVLNLYGAFDKKECNPDNLISADAVTDYKSSGDYNTGHGIKYTVKEHGEVKVKGTATADVTVKLGSGITLTEGKSYTFTCDVKTCGYDTYGLYLVKGDTKYYAEIDDTIKVASGEGGDYTLYLYIKKDAKVNTTFYPVLVEGTNTGSFWKK